MKSDWGIYDINISASSTFNAIRSVSKNDDEALIQQMLSGDDYLLYQMKMMLLMVMLVMIVLKQV